MRNETIDGIGSLSGGEFNEVNIDGISKLKHPLTAKSVRVDGIFKSKAKIQADFIHFDGIARILKDIKAKKLDINGIVKIRRGSLHADEIRCDGILVCNREVNADYISIDGSCSIKSIYGDTVLIHSEEKENQKARVPGRLGFLVKLYFGRKVKNSLSLVDHIECTHLEGHNIKCRVVYANSVKLTGMSEIEVLHCDGDIDIASTCRIGKIVGTENTVKEMNNMSNPTIRKILDLYKEGKIDANEAETMLGSLGVADNTHDNPKVPWDDDGKLRVVAYIGRRLLKKGEAGQNKISVSIEGAVLNVEAHGNVECQQVTGSVSAGGNVSCHDILGSVSCGGTVQCSQIHGSVSAGGGIRIDTGR